MHARTSWIILLAGAFVAIAGCNTSELEAKDARIAELEAEGSNIAQTLEQCKKDRENLDKLISGLTADAAESQDQIAAMEAALAEAAAREAAAKKRLETYRSMLTQLKSMIDSGKLKVRIVRNRMVVELPEGVLFASGSAKVKKDGIAVLQELTPVLVNLKDQLFEVGGHTDNIPIRNRRFPSNWELSAARAVNVTKLLTTSGMGADRVSATAYAETQPVESNETKEGRALNRRIEIALLPNLDELPDLSQLDAK